MPKAAPDSGISAAHTDLGDAQARVDLYTDRPSTHYTPPLTTPVVTAPVTVQAQVGPAVVTRHYAPRPVALPPAPAAVAPPRAPSNWMAVPSLSMSYPVGAYTDCNGQAPLRYDEPSRDTCVPASEVFLVGHNPGVFEDLPSIQLGAEVDYFDAGGATHVFHIYKITRVPEQQGGSVMANDHPPLLMQTCVDSSGSEYWYFYGS